MTNIIKSELEKCLPLQDDNFKIISPYTLGKTLDGEKIQQKEYSECMTAHMRTVLSPSGAYVCPYHRGNKNWSVIKRESSEFDAGVGINKYVDGTGLWKHLIGAECKYGIKYFEEANYSVEKCKISEKTYNELSKN